MSAMSATTTKRTSLLVCQYWITVLRLLDAITGCGYTIYSFAYLTNGLDIGNLVLFSFLLVFWITLALNDAFILTLDFARNNTYIGCVAAQVVLSVTAVVITCIGSGMALLPMNVALRFPLFYVPVGFGAFWSLFLLAIVLHPVILLRTRVPLRHLCMCNTKDLFLGTFALPNISPIVLSIFGHRREVPHLGQRVLYTSGNAVKRFFLRVLFRRVSPVESKVHAFVQNMFAILAVVILVTRTVTALAQAQNKFETRIQSKECIGVGPSSSDELQLLVKNNTKYDWTLSPNSRIDVMLETDRGLEQCDQELLPTRFASSLQLATPYDRFQVFSCISSRPTSFLSDRTAIYHITVNSLNGSSLAYIDMPRIWLSDKSDYPDIPQTPGEGSIEPIMNSVAPLYSPSLELLPGFHHETEAGLITRRFIKSSMLRDLITMDSEYTQVSLFPIITSGTSLLSNATVATATLRVTLKPGFNYLRSQKAFWDSQQTERSYFDTCDFVEDYRSSTVFDVLGSVGGLFAILQAIHVLLFGRPMLWGLTGAKTITPFGLFGAFGSQSFRRRLREQYHRQPTDDNPDTIQIGAFLRDFVIDFGPADVESNAQTQKSSDELLQNGTQGRKGTDHSQIPLTCNEPTSPADSKKNLA